MIRLLINKALRPTLGFIQRLFPSVTNQERNCLIDVLRGLSIIMVVFSHYSMLHALFGPTCPWFARSIDDIGNGMGYFGVSVFFTISGFLITSISIKRYPMLPKIDFSGFWWLRFSRVMPMMLLVAATMIVFQICKVRNFVYTDVVNLEKALTGMFSFHFYEVMGCDPGITAWNPLWSLSVEEMFYLAFPFVCLCLNGFGSIIWIFTIAIISALYFRISGGAGPFSTIGCIDQLAIGSLLALLRADRLKEVVHGWTRICLGIALAALGIAAISACTILWHPFKAFTWSPLLASLGAGLFITASQLIHPPRLIKVLLWPISMLGILSYEIYLIHMPILIYLRNFNYLHYSIGLILVVAISLIIHEYYSEPANRLMRRLHKPREASPDPGTKPSQGRVDPAGSQVLKWTGIIAVPFILVASLSALALLRDHTHLSLRIISVARLPPGTSEPIAYIGSFGAADQVLLRHDADDRISVGIDHWGVGATYSAELSRTELENAELIIDFGTQFVEVKRNGASLVRSEHPTHSPYGTMALGINDIGLNTVLRATTTFERIK